MSRDRSAMPWLDDVSCGTWIVDALAPGSGTVATLVPSTFASCALIASADSPHVHPDRIVRDRLIAVIHAAGLMADRCTFGVCEVYGWTGGATASVPLLASDAEAVPVAGQEPYSRPMLDLPCRSYMLYSGPIEDARRLDDVGAPRGLPDLWWPDDRSWFVATDTDLTATLFAGPPFLTTLVASDHRLRVVPVAPGDPLQ